MIQQHVRSSALCVFFLAFAALRPAGAQILPLHFLEAPAAELMTTALSEPYGRMIVAVTTDVIKASATQGCLQTAPGQTLTARVEAILQRRGTQIVEITARSVDRAAFRDALAAKLGSGAFEEREALKNNPVVQEYRALAGPSQAALTINSVMEQLSRFLILQSIKLAGELPQSITNDYPEITKADPWSNDFEKLGPFQEQAKSPHLDRYVVLTEAAQETLDAVYKASEAYQKLGPKDVAGGFDADLAELCVKVR